MTFERLKKNWQKRSTTTFFLKYENKVTVKKLPIMKVQNNAKLSSFLGGDFVGCEVTRYQRRGQTLECEDFNHHDKLLL